MITFIETITFIQYVLQFYDILKTCNKISCYVTGYMCGSMCSVSTGLSSYIYRNHTNRWSEFLRFQKCRELQAYAKPQQIKGCVVKTTTIIIIINDIIIIISYIIIMSISSSWHHHHGIIINIGNFSRLAFLTL